MNEWMDGWMTSINPIMSLKRLQTNILLSLVLRPIAQQEDHWLVVSDLLHHRIPIGKLQD